MTQEEILRMINAAGDSVWVIEDTIAKLDAGEIPTSKLYGDIERNVEHLKLVVSNQEIIDSGEDISNLNSGISLGEAKLAEDIWPAVTE